eukprot:s5803_g1.t1
MTDGDQQLMEAFLHMNHLFVRDPDQQRDAKKHKANQQEPKPSVNDQGLKILQAMGTLLLRLDQDNQAMRRQDSWVFFIQTGPHGILPLLTSSAQKWHQLMQQKQPMEDIPPLRCQLLTTLVNRLHDRLLQLAQAQDTDELKTTAISHGMLTKENMFPYQRWHQQNQRLQLTTQPPIPLPRMIKYLEQLKELVADPQAVITFRALKQQDNATTIPWLLQVSLRADDFQQLMLQLQGSTLWGLVGLSLKPHTLPQSRPAAVLRDLLGKGTGKNQSKSKGKSK